VLKGKNLMLEKKVVPFRSNEGISYSLTQRLLKKGENFGVKLRLNRESKMNLDKISRE